MDRYLHVVTEEQLRRLLHAQHTTQVNQWFRILAEPIIIAIHNGGQCFDEADRYFFSRSYLVS